MPSTCPSSPLSPLDLSPESPLPLGQGGQQQRLNDSPLSTLSPQSSFETDEAHVKYSWSCGTTPSLEDQDEVIRRNELGQEVTVVNNDETTNTKQQENKNKNAPQVQAQDVSRSRSPQFMHGATPRAGTTKRSFTPRAASTPKSGIAMMMMSEKTPKAGTAVRHHGRDNVPKKIDTTNVPPTHQRGTRSDDDCDDGGSKEEHDLDMSTPSWDVSTSFSFRKNEKKQQQLQQGHHNHHHQQQQHHRPQQSHSSFSGIWDFMSAIGLSRSESMAADDEGTIEEGEGDGSDDSPPLSESKENDLFAMEVGLMFSTDEGDTINDPSTLYSKNFSSSFTIESETTAMHSPAYDLAKYLKYRRENGLENAGSASMEQDNTHDDSITNTHTADESTINTAGQSTVRDDHGNKIPENAKMILGYENAAKRRKGNNKKTKNKNNIDCKDNNNQKAFPTLKNNTDTAPQEMEKRLRDLAGQISADWVGPSFMAPALARRLRDFQFAREKRRKKYGNTKPWGILGLYDHLSGVKIDVEWAEDAAWRRQNMQPYLTWGDFEAKKNAGLNRPFFTFLVVSICTAMMVTSIAVNDWKFEPLSINPMIGPSAETLVTLGAKDSYLIVVQQEIWRLVSPMVLHAGLIHYTLNMFALWFVGRAIEQIHGFFPAVVQFVVPAIGGTILSAIFLPEYITVGASGGIFGLIGACISDIIMNWNLLFNEFVNERGARLSHARVLLVLFLDIVLNCIIGLTPFVDNFTHLGGMIYGFLCGLSTIRLVSPRFFGDDRQFFHRCKLLFFRSFGLFVCMASIIASSVVLFSGDGDTNPCKNCTYMSCVSFPPWVGNNEKWWYCDTCNQASAAGTLDTTTGKFIELNINCPNGSTETVGMNPAWPQDEIGLESILPTLCREHCIW